MRNRFRFLTAQNSMKARRRAPLPTFHQTISRTISEWDRKRKREERIDLGIILSVVGAVIFCLTMALLGGCAHAQPQRLALTPAVSHNLEFFFEKMTSEFVFCAHGEVRGAIIRIDQLTVPKIDWATPTNVHFAPSTCPKRRLIGIIHSHPNSDGEICNLSHQDLSSFSTVKWLKYDLAYCSDKRIVWLDRPGLNEHYPVFADQKAK